ncbi:MAG: AAA family ATPase [Lentisphaeria bacterium]|jgi:hypothetical protein|nr:AAA family ATPase [Lentisphaeria bacterium]
MNPANDNLNHDGVLLQILERCFHPADNLRRDRENEAAAINEERASLLIHGISSPAELKTFLRVGEEKHDVLVAPMTDEDLNMKFEAQIQAIGHYSSQFLEEYHYFMIVLGMGLHRIDEYSTVHAIQPPKEFWRTMADSISLLDFGLPISVYGRGVDNDTGRQTLASVFQGLLQLSLLRMCQAVGYRGNAANVIRNRGADPRPYGDLKMRGRRLRPAQHPLGGGTGLGGATENLAANIKHSDQANQIVHRYFHLRMRRDGMVEKNGLVHKTYGGVWTPVIKFRDAHGQIQQTVAKYFCSGDGVKTYYPFTLWDEVGLHGSHAYMVPMHPQPLLHLDLLVDDADAPVVLTDLIDIAYLNQGSGPFIWTSFLCDEGQYDQVDWKPLAGRTVYLLVANHSGMTLAEAYLKADELRQHLVDTLDDIDLRFAQVDVEYPSDNRRFGSLGELEDHWDSNPPAVRPGSAAIMDEELFEDRLLRAEESLRRPAHFYQDFSPAVQEAVTKVNEGRTLIRPILIEGRGGLFISSEGAGKSAACLSMSAALIGQDHFVEDVFWTIPPEVRGKAIVVYFEAETDAKHREESNRDFVLPYLASDPGKRAEQEKRLLRVDMQADERNLDDPATRDWVLDQVRGHQAQFEPGSPLLVILDPYLALVGYAEKETSWGKVRTLVNALKKLGAAVLLVHHSNRAGGSDGNHNKERDVRCVIKMEYCEGKGPFTLDVPRKIGFGKGNAIRWNADLTPFRLRRDPETGRWVVPEAEEEDGKTPGFKLQRFARLVDCMRASGCTNEDIFKELCIPKSTFYEMLKAAGLSKKDSQEAAD